MNPERISNPNSFENISLLRSLFEECVKNNPEIFKKNLKLHTSLHYIFNIESVDN
ncbi:MAG: hypothetical protein US33_C0039G0001 [Parcubacteria group bacterium GW2011_GWC1_36_9]|uniref:Uncharacterized protein n=1 Tax=Candidatus Yanofskybacteria bacterium GW2011_GWC2_37_9 TaxID=1619028 RepID=A0A0G0I7D8_9BACT|nr:MAG: hypothetical protein US33_C0039G0001 [Parcubacteria group bacterium GW2011_GWC1_36_9]KKQ46900.1 MAG: hypothetical protein US65_C0023G0002 [Candidatus Yanofskybacteria bacterium GW2011_GWC2_37_9]